jgi:hypothetical protein
MKFHALCEFLEKDAVECFLVGEILSLQGLIAWLKALNAVVDRNCSNTQGLDCAKRACLGFPSLNQI